MVILGSLVPAVAVWVPPLHVWAYLDPGSGSMALQILLAGLLSSCFFVKSWYRRLRDALSMKRRRIVGED
jgi:hypothetical protein